MRVVDILCVVVVTKLLVTSDASSTPADYSTHSLISVDTHDAVRALRVGDESDIQEERALSVFDPMLSYIPGTAAHDAAKVAKVENKLALKHLPESQHIEYFESLQTIHLKWTKFGWLLYKNVKPKHLELLLKKHKKSDDVIKSIVGEYTGLHTEFGLNKPKKGIEYNDAEKFAKLYGAEKSVLRALGIAVDSVDDWSKLLLEDESKWDQLVIMLVEGVNPDDLKMTLQRNEMNDDAIKSIVHTYSNMFWTYTEETANLLREDSLAQVAKKYRCHYSRKSGMM